MAFLIEENRCTSPTSNAQVNAVIGPTAGMVINRSTRSTNRRVVLQGAYQRTLGLPQAYHRFTTQAQQRT